MVPRRQLDGHHDADVNRLTNEDDIDVVTGMMRYFGVPVSLHPW
jgi:hypothetical protein